MESAPEFSFRTRQEAIRRFGVETFDLLVVGGGITGAAVARDAVSRGLSVALIERGDFAQGTSSRSSKLIHGGLRYLENFEFGLVFEALSERALLLKTAPHRVRPLPFYWPIYQGDANGRFILTLGMWFYDLLALFRAPGFHKRFSRRGMLREIPFLRKDGLKGGVRYYDASMWDDVLAVETLRAASRAGAAVANYVEALSPLWEGTLIQGFRVRDLESQSECDLRARRVVICAGPWTDEVGSRLSPEWKHWLKPSRGVHLIFDLKRIPIPGAMVMNHPTDGRISFVIPRPDFGAGVVIVGTTDGPSPQDPGKVAVGRDDIEYLMALLQRYFPQLNLTEADIVSAYVGVRPLMDPEAQQAGKADEPSSISLQKVSREHHIDRGPGGTTVVAGGKYTTHRKMAEEIVDFALERWKADAAHGKGPEFPPGLKVSSTQAPVNPLATAEATAQALRETKEKIPAELLSRYGAEALQVMRLRDAHDGEGPEGFPLLAAQIRYAIGNEMVLHLEDFYLRRIPLYASRADHGLPWGEELLRAWGKEREVAESQFPAEFARLKAELDRRSSWRKG